MPSEARDLAFALAVSAMIERDAAIAGAKQKGDAVEQLHAIAAQAVKKGDRPAWLRRCGAPAGEAQAVGGRAGERVPMMISRVGWRFGKSRAGTGQPTGNGIGGGKIADAGCGGQAGQDFVDPRSGARGLGHKRPPAATQGLRSLCNLSAIRGTDVEDFGQRIEGFSWKLSS